MSTAFEGFVARGLLSVFLSRGPENITAEINQRWPGSTQVTDHGWAVAWFANVPWLIAQSKAILKRGKKLFLAGHSFGGSAVIMVAQALAREGLPVHLLCPIDPAWQYTTKVPANVKRVVGFYQRRPGQLGEGILVKGTDWTKQEWDTRAVDYKRVDTHLGIVKEPFVHETIIKELQKL
jgi:hypothetical protein